ncbi:MAG: hypothetical protein ACRC0L_06575, partial [Angustibacter sp.]
IRAQIRPSAHGQGHVARQAVLSALRLAESLGRSLDDVVADIAATTVAEGFPLPLDQISHYLGWYGARASDSPSIHRIVHLSFLTPAGLAPESLLAALDFSGDATVLRAHTQIIDVYAGPNLPDGQISVTLSATLDITPGTPLNDILRAAVPGVEALGARLRGNLG